MPPSDPIFPLTAVCQNENYEAFSVRYYEKFTSFRPSYTISCKSENVEIIPVSFFKKSSFNFTPGKPEVRYNLAKVWKTEAISYKILWQIFLHFVKFVLGKKWKWVLYRAPGRSWCPLKRRSNVSLLDSLGHRQYSRKSRVTKNVV